MPLQEGITTKGTKHCGDKLSSVARAMLDTWIFGQTTDNSCGGIGMGYSFSKAKLPKSTSYPLKRSALDRALEEANVKDLVFVSYLRTQRPNEVMRADYHGEHGTGSYASGKTSVTVYSVPGKLRAAMESALLNEGVKAIVGWLVKAETAGNTWRAVDHQLVLKFSMQSLTQIES